MGIPLPKTEYARLSRVTRKGLGLLIAGHPELFKKDALTAWNEFHKDLPQFCVLASNRNVGSFELTFSQLLGDLTNYGLTLDWMLNDFRSSPDRIIRIFDYFKQRFKDCANEENEKSKACLAFATRMGLSLKWIDSHFWIADNVLLMKRRSRWELFIDQLASPNDEVIKFSWFEPIRYCIEFRRFRIHWRDLREAIGHARLSELIDEFEADFSCGKYELSEFDRSDFDRLRELVKNSRPTTVLSEEDVSI